MLVSYLFVARVWEDYASDHLLATSLRMFHIRSLVPFLDLTKYPLMSSLSKRLSSDRVREISILLRLVRKSTALVLETIWCAFVVTLAFANIVHVVDPWVGVGHREGRSHQKVKQTQSTSSRVN